MEVIKMTKVLLISGSNRKGNTDYILNRLNKLPKMFNKIPVLAVTITAQLINIIKTLLNAALSLFTQKRTRFLPARP